MNMYEGGVTFSSIEPLGVVARTLSDAYFGGLPFIPKDRRWTREYDEATYSEFDLLGFEVCVCRDSGEAFHLEARPSELWPPAWTHEELAVARRTSATPWLAVLLRALPGFVPQLRPMHAGLPVAVIDSHTRLNARCTFEEVLAMFTQRLCCGLRFVPGSNAADGWTLERELFGHQVAIRRSAWGNGHYLSITPSAAILASLTESERATLIRLDMTEYMQALLRDHPWLRGGLALTPEEIEEFGSDERG